MMLGKRIIDTKMSISQWADTPEYKGQKLLANYKVDVDGVAPKKSLPIIENGILKTLLTVRWMLTAWLLRSRSQSSRMVF